MHASVGNGQKQHIAHINIFKNTLSTVGKAISVTAIRKKKKKKSNHLRRKLYGEHFQGTLTQWERLWLGIVGRQLSTDFIRVFKLRMKNGFPEYTFPGFAEKPCVAPGTFKVPSGNILA